MAAGGGRGGDRRRRVRGAAEGGRGVAVDQPGVSHRQGRQCRAVDHGLVVGGDRQRGRGDGQSPGHVADAVVRIDRPAGRDAVGIAAGMAAGGGRGGDRRRRVRGAAEGGRGVAVDQPGVSHRQGRQCRAVDLGLIVGGDRQWRRGDGQSPGHVADAIVRIDRPAGRDAVGIAADMAAGGGRGGDRRRRVRGLLKVAGVSPLTSPV